MTKPAAIQSPVLKPRCGKSTTTLRMGGNFTYVCGEAPGHSGLCVDIYYDAKFKPTKASAA